MQRATNTATVSANTLECALEMSKNTWLLGIQFPDRDQPSVYSVKGGDAAALLAKLIAARNRWAKVSGSPPLIVLCYEVGYDAFWLARFLMAHGIECLVIDPGSLEVKRRSRRVKTDRVDLKKLLRTLSAWRRGERHVWSLCRVPDHAAYSAQWFSKVHFASVTCAGARYAMTRNYKLSTPGH